MSDSGSNIGEVGGAAYIPATERMGIALCLSGGGYRAALFHSGAVRRLNELGILGRIDAISAVSGGSIFAAHLATRISQMKDGRFEDYEADVAAPFRNFTKNNIRTAPALRPFLPWEWGNAAAQAEGLQDEYERLLCPGVKLKDLPVRPAFCFCSTDLAFGVNWEFTRDRVGDYQAGYMSPEESGQVPLARAVAASSCFPPVFKPLPLRLTASSLPVLGKTPASPQRDACIAAISLSDGGVYDNMGLEPVWKNCATLLVCDGGKPFRFSRSLDTLHQLLRLTDVMGDQAEAVRKRWLIASYINGVYGGAYWGIGSAVADYPVTGVPGYSGDLARDVISEIRTDMDRFSDSETAVLENHGYLLAEAAIKAHVGQLHQQVPLRPAVNALWPNLATLSSVEQQVRTDLAGSDQIKLGGH